MLRRGGVLAAALLSLALSGCMGYGEGTGRTQGNLMPGGAVPVRLVDCRDWRGAHPSERADMIAALRKFAGGASGSPGGHGSTLPDGSAYELFDSYCANGFARAFKLYKLYTRAAAFQTVAAR